MADPRLVWNDVEAPDFSRASAALARANQSFNSSFDTASSLLQKYAEGQITKADNELLSSLSQLGSEEEFDKFVDKGGLNNKNISKDLRTHILNMRTGFVADDGTRASTEATRANTGINLAREGRDASEYSYGVRNRDELAALSGVLVGARTEGRQSGLHGNAAGTNPARYRDAIASIESDGSGGYQAVGANNPKLGRALGRYQIMEANLPQWSQAALGRQVSVEEFMAKPEIQDAIFDHRFGSYVDKYGEENAARAWFGGEGGINKTGATDVHGRLTIGDYGKDFINALDRTNPRPADTAFRTSLANSQTLSPAQIDALLGQTNASQSAGQGILDDARARADKEGAELVDEIGGTIITDVLKNPDILTPAQFDQAIIRHDLGKGLTESERLDLIQRAAGVRSSEAGSNILSPPATVPIELQVGAANTIAAADNAFRSTDQNRAVGDVETFSENPTEALISVLELDKDGESPTSITGLRQEIGFDRNNLTNLINKYAEEFEVQPAVVAVAMRDAFRRDPWGRNTLAKRFDKEKVREAVAQVDQEAFRNYREKKSNNDLLEFELGVLQASAVQLEKQIAKTETASVRAALQQQLDNLNTQVARIEAARRN